MALKKKQAGGLGSLLGGLLGTLIPIPGVGTAVGSAVGGALGGAAGGALGEEERGAGPAVPQVDFSVSDVGDSPFLQNMNVLSNAGVLQGPQSLKPEPLQAMTAGGTTLNLADLSKKIGDSIQQPTTPRPSPVAQRAATNTPDVDAPLSLKSFGSNRLSGPEQRQALSSGLLAGKGPKAVKDVLSKSDQLQKSFSGVGQPATAAPVADAAGLSGGDIASLAASGLGSLAQALAKGSPKRPPIQTQQPTFQQDDTLMQLLQGLPVAAPGGL